MEFAAVLARDVAYFLLNAPSIESTKIPVELERRQGKYYHFALRCVDAFILYDTLYWDYSVPIPSCKGRAFHQIARSLFGNRQEFFTEDRRKFYKILCKSGVIKPIPLPLEGFKQLYEDTINDIEYLIEQKHLQKVWEDTEKSLPSPYKFAISTPDLLLESSIFWNETRRLLPWGIYRRARELQRTLHPLIMRSEHYSIIPWIFSALLCGKLQAVLNVPGVYSTFSFPYSSFFASWQATQAREHVVKETFTEIIDSYRKLLHLRVKIPIPSFSAWCAGTGQTSKTFSNLEILKRAIEVRNNRFIRAFRSKFWEIVTDILSRSWEDQTSDKIQLKVSEILSQTVSHLIQSSIPEPWKSRFKSATLTVLISTPLSFFMVRPVIELLSDLSIEFIQRSLSARRKDKEFGWLFFLHEEISGYS